MFRCALALFKYKEEEFLKLEDSTAIFKYLRYFTRTILDSRYSVRNGLSYLHALWPVYKQASYLQSNMSFNLKHIKQDSMQNKSKPSQTDILVLFFQEADEHRFWGHEPVPYAVDPEPPLLPPGEGPSGADGAGGHQTDLPPGERDDSGQAELRQRR